MTNEHPAPMTAEEQKELDELEVKMKGEISAGKQITADDFKRYAYLVKKWRTSFVHVPADPYYTDPATWPDWANWTAAHEVGVMCFYELRPVIRSYSSGCWWPGAGGRVEPFRVITHNPDWRNSLRGREEVGDGK